MKVLRFPNSDQPASLLAALSGVIRVLVQGIDLTSAGTLRISPNLGQRAALKRAFFVSDEVDTLSNGATVILKENNPNGTTTATLTTALSSADNDIKFTARSGGTVGNGITVAYVRPAAPSSTLNVTANLTARTISVSLATDAGTKQVETATASGTITAGTAQVETATVIGTVTPVSGGGNATVVVTAAGMTNSPKTIGVAVLASDDASAVAGKIRTALIADDDVGSVTTGFFTITGAGANIILTANTKAANDATINVSIDNGTCTGLTAAPSSANTTAGIAPGTGNATVVVTSAHIPTSPVSVSVAVVASDTASAWAAKVRTALNANAAITAVFAVGGSSANITLTPIVAVANDSTLNISLDNGTCTGITPAATSANTTAGIAPAVTSTATLVLAAVQANADAMRLVSAALAAGNDGSGLVAAMSALPLAGGAANVSTDVQTLVGSTNLADTDAADLEQPLTPESGLYAIQPGNDITLGITPGTAEADSKTLVLEFIPC